MTQINPLTGALVQSSVVQQRAVDEKDRQIRRKQNLSRNSALRGDRLEHQVESAEAVAATHEQADGDPRKRQRRAAHQPNTSAGPASAGEPPRLDVTA